jgi:leucyl-tRNA synthetase
MPVDLYIGGAEHAVLHLLYARFWHKVLYDLGHVSTPEPFIKLVHQGMILGADNRKMSKSLGNVVNPDDIIAQFGADSMRLYEMFMGPLEATKPWNTNGVDGVRRFLQRVWRLVVDEDTDACQADDSVLSAALNRVVHKTIKKVTEGLETLRLNTAISAMMELTNAFTKEKVRARDGLTTLVQLLAPFAPHIGEELWARLGHTDTLTYTAWPAFEPALVVDDLVTYAVQVNGKLRGQAELPADCSKDEAIAAAKALENVVRFLEGKTIRREIFVPKRMVNFVAN